MLFCISLQRTAAGQLLQPRLLGQVAVGIGLGAGVLCIVKCPDQGRQFFALAPTSLMYVWYTKKATPGSLQRALRASAL